MINTQMRSLVALCAWLFSVAAAATPDITMKDLQGKEHNVSEYIGKGKWTVVTIWAHDCPICKQEIYHMTFFHDAHKNKDATVLGVSIDGYANKARAQKFIDDQGLNFPNLITDPQTIGKFGGGALVGTPTVYIFSPQGELVAKNIGATTQEDVEKFISSARPAKKGEPKTRAQ